METIDVNWDNLMRQAPMTVHTYLYEAVKLIDSVFNEDGYAKAHPELVGAFLQGCALDLLTSAVGGGLVDLARAVSEISTPEAH